MLNRFRHPIACALGAASLCADIVSALIAELLTPAWVPVVRDLTELPPEWRAELHAAAERARENAVVQWTRRTGIEA